MKITPQLIGRLDRFFCKKGFQSEAADLAQQTAIKAWSAVSRGIYKENGRFEQYCLRIANNVMLDHCRRKRREADRLISIELLDPLPATAIPRSSSSSGFEVDYRKLRAMDKTDRTVFLDRALRRKTVTRSCEENGMNWTKFTSIYRKALATLSHTE